MRVQRLAQRRKRPSLLLLCSMPLMLAAPGHAEAQQGADRTKVQARLDANRNLLKESEARAGSIKSDMGQLTEERAKLNTDLIKTGDAIKKTERQMTAIEKRLGVLEKKETSLRTSLGSRHQSIAGLLGAMQRMGRNPPPVIITQRSDALKMVRSAMLLARAFPKLRGEAEALSTELNELVTVLTGIRQESERLRQQSVELREARSKLDYLMQTKRQSLNVRRMELAEVEKTVKVVGRNVGSLEQLLKTLEPELKKKTIIGREISAAELKQSPKAEELRPAIKPPETKVAINIPPPAIRPTQPSPPATPVVIRPPANPAPKPQSRPSIVEPAVKLAPDGGFIGNAARLTPAIPFHRARGQLPLPAEGNVETRFGESTQFGGRSKGIVIKTRYGAQITSPCDGWVVYAGKFRTYKQLLIIKAGNGYHVLLAGLSRIDVKAGQFILAAEPVGTMKNAPGQRAGKDSPRLYVEFRKDGRPINPRPWWSASATQKVQG